MASLCFRVVPAHIFISVALFMIKPLTPELSSHWSEDMIKNVEYGILPLLGEKRQTTFPEPVEKITLHNHHNWCQAVCLFISFQISPSTAHHALCVWLWNVNLKYYKFIYCTNKKMQIYIFMCLLSCMTLKKTGDLFRSQTESWFTALL